MSSSSTRRSMQESLTERATLETPGEGRCTLVTYPAEEQPERIPIITNPDLTAELCLFFSILAIGFLLMYTSSDYPRVFDYGIIFFNAGMIPAVVSFVAPLVRYGAPLWEKTFFEEAAEKHEALMYLAFVGTGIAMIVVDREAFQDTDDDPITWQLILGATTLETGLVYVVIRSFLRTEAPEDRARRLQKEVEYLRESISKGVSESYFLNFIRWVCKDIMKSRLANEGRVAFQPDASRQANQPQEHVVQNIRAMVVMIPILGEDAFHEGSDSHVLTNYQRIMERSLGSDAARGSIKPPVTTNGRSFSRAQKLVKLTLEVSDTSLDGQQQQQDTLSQENRSDNSVEVFFDIPSTLLTVWSSIAGNARYPGPSEKADAFARDARRFSSQLVWNLQRTRESLDDTTADGLLVHFPNLVVVMEYEGDITNFSGTAIDSMRRHFLGFDPVAAQAPQQPQEGHPGSSSPEV